MEIAAIPPMTPPMMTPSFELCRPVDAGVVMFEKGPPNELVGPLAETEVSEGLSVMPRTYLGGVYGTDVRE
jgi:hypothetical protein